MDDTGYQAKSQSRNLIPFMHPGCKNKNGLDQQKSQKPEAFFRSCQVAISQSNKNQEQHQIRKHINGEIPGKRGIYMGKVQPQSAIKVKSIEYSAGIRLEAAEVNAERQIPAGIEQEREKTPIPTAAAARIVCRICQ